MKTIILMTWLILLSFGLTIAGEDEAEQITIDDLAWMSGRWIGEAFDGVCEEVWNPQMGASMTGSFKLTINDKVGFYEIMTLTVDNGNPKLRLKHFNADLTGWEEKDEVISFEFRSLEGHHLIFNGLSYELIQADSLTITVGTEDPSGKSHQTVINCHREN